VRIINSLTILATFGAAFPPLVITICLAMLTKTYYIQLLLSRLVALAEVSEYCAYRACVEENCKHIYSSFRKSVTLVIPCAALFYACFMFDTMGDETGWIYAIWMPIVMILVIFCYSCALFRPEFTDFRSEDEKVKLVR